MNFGGFWLFDFVDNEILLTLGNLNIILEDGTKIKPGKFVMELNYESGTLSIGNIQFQEEWLAHK